MTTSTPKKRSTGRTLLTIFGALILACVICGVIGYIVAGPAIRNTIDTVAAPVTANNDFINAVIAKDYAKAYGLILPAQQTAFGGSVDGFQQLITTNGWDLTSYTFTNIQLGSEALINGTGTFPSGTKYIYLILNKDGDSWKVAGLKISNDAPTATPAS